MDEKAYQSLAAGTFKRIVRALDELDSDVVDCETNGDVITVTLNKREKCVINTQRATHQIWLAAESRGWHFSFDPTAGSWTDDKGHGDELFATLSRVIAAKTTLIPAF